jgi:hypothetical protein
MEDTFEKKAENLKLKILSILIGLVFIYGGCGILSTIHKDKPLETSFSEAEKDDNKDYYEYFELKNAIISPIIYSDTVDKNKTEIFIGIISPERWMQAKINLKINDDDSDAAAKLLNSDFKPSFFYLTEVSQDDTLDMNYYVNRIGDSLQVKGYKFTFDSRPQISAYLQAAYAHDLPILIAEAPSGARLKGFGVILIGIVIVVIPLRMMYKKFMNSDPNYVP